MTTATKTNFLKHDGEVHVRSNDGTDIGTFTIETMASDAKFAAGKTVLMFKAANSKKKYPTSFAFVNVKKGKAFVWKKFRADGYKAGDLAANRSHETWAAALADWDAAVESGEMSWADVTYTPASEKSLADKLAAALAANDAETIFVTAVNGTIKTEMIGDPAKAEELVNAYKAAGATVFTHVGVSV